MAAGAHVTAAVWAFVADRLSCLENSRILDRLSRGLGGVRNNYDQGEEGKGR